MIEVVKATCTATGNGLQMKTGARGFDLILDEPKEMGGGNTGMNPIECLLCALGACQGIVAKAFASAHDFKFEDFHVELEGDFDPDGFSGVNPDAINGYSEIRVRMHFKTEEPKEKVDAFVEFIEATCPVGDTLKRGVKVVNMGTVIEK